MSKSEEIAQVKMGKPHVVILGAGASIAATRPFGGDKHGKKLPGMVDFTKTLDLEDLLVRGGIPFSGRNFEDIYDEIHSQASLDDLRRDLESRIHSYFSSLELPDAPTDYDRLVLSLRGKDVIATFNWDPFLIQAYRRNSGLGFALPALIFLHGNVLAGYCPCGKYIGLNGTVCPKCGEYLIPSDLLYPIRNKNYNASSFIRTQWEALSQKLDSAFMVTIFGYGAPSSDIAAVGLMKKAWGSPSHRNMEQFEVINILPEDELYRTWSPFIHSHHYEIHRSLDMSWIGKHPRRTGEAYFNQYWEAQFIEENCIPELSDLADLQEWFKNFSAPEMSVEKQFR